MSYRAQQHEIRRIKLGKSLSYDLVPPKTPVLPCPFDRALVLEPNLAYLKNYSKKNFSCPDDLFRQQLRDQISIHVYRTLSA